MILMVLSDCFSISLSLYQAGHLTFWVMCSKLLASVVLKLKLLAKYWQVAEYVSVCLTLVTAASNRVDDNPRVVF